MHFFPYKFDQKTCNNSNYWKTAGLRPAIFRGTPGNFNYQVKFRLLEKSFRGTPGNFIHKVKCT